MLRVDRSQQCVANNVQTTIHAFIDSVLEYIFVLQDLEEQLQIYHLIKLTIKANVRLDDIKKLQSYVQIQYEEFYGETYAYVVRDENRIGDDDDY